MKLLLTAIIALMLVGCANTPTKTVFIFPDVPEKFMVAPQQPAPIVPAADGTADPKSALATIMDNNTKAKNNSDELAGLQQWIVNTKKNIDSQGKKP